MDYLLLALPAIISAVILGIVAAVAKKITAFLADFKAEHMVLLESQRNQLKSSIVRAYQLAVQRECISPLDLETMNREFDSYKALGGNHYVHTLVKRMNSEIAIVGEPVPEEGHAE